MSLRHLSVLGAIVLVAATVLVLEGSALATAWLPLEEAAVLQRARGGGGEALSAGLLYPALLAPAAHLLSATDAYELATALAAVLWAATAIPAYWLARRLVQPWPALAVAALAVAIPASVYATAAVSDALALLLAACSLPLLARASDRGNLGELAGALALAAAAAATRPWLVVLPFALLAAYGAPRPRWRSALRWPRSLGLAALLGVAYFALAAISDAAASAFTTPGAVARGAVASVVVVAVGTGVVPMLLAVAEARRLPGRPEPALLATCLPALALASGVLAAASPVRGVDERPLLVLTPLVLSLAAAAWLEGSVSLRAAAVVGTLLALAAFALPALGSAPVARAAGLSVLSADGGSRTFLVAGTAAAVAVALLMIRILRGRPLLLAPAIGVLLVAGQAAAWSNVRSEADALAATEPSERGWIDLHAGPGARVVVTGPAESLQPVPVAQLALWNRAVRGTQQLDLSRVDPQSGQWGVAPGAEEVLMRGGVEVSGTELARSDAGVLVRPETPYRLAQTVEGVYPDGWSGERAVYRRFTATPGVVRVSVDRRDAPAGAEPATIRIESGPRDESPSEERHFVLRPGERRAVDVEVPLAPYEVVVTIDPTFAAADGRQLGAGLRFAYRPRR